jgi:hypothetical protein
MKLFRNIRSLVLFVCVYWFICVSFIAAPKADNNIDKICDQINRGHIDSCSFYINNYFQSQAILPSEQPFPDPFIEEELFEMDNFMTELDKLGCVDTSYYLDGRGSILKSMIPSADIVIIFNLNGKKDKYYLHMSFTHPMNATLYKPVIDENDETNN